MDEKEKHTEQPEKPIAKAGQTDKWYAVYTRPRAEKLVYQRLVEAGIETFLPLQKTLRIWSDRKKMVEKPLLASYIFVRTTSLLFPVVYKTDGVVKFVSITGTPSPIPQNQIDNLRLLINSDAEMEVTGEKFEKGDFVRVTSGSLLGLTGELISIKGTKRVVVRIDKLEQNIVVSIPPPFLKKIKNPAL